MDLVKIGFVVSANGLKDANTEVDKLLNRVDKIGSGSKKNASDFENSQKRIKDSSKSTTNEVDKTTKALERQRLIGDYLAKGLDRTTATAIANFKQLGGTTSQVNALMTSLANNKGIIQAQKVIDDAEKARQKKFSDVQREYQKTMELQKRLQERSDQIVEAARQKRFAAVQREYQKTMELHRQPQKENSKTSTPTPTVSAVSDNGSKLFDQIKGIAAYALLSTAIYGAMTATFGLIAATIKMADEYTSTQQRLKLYIKDAQTLGEVNTFLAKSAIQNNVGLRENAALYAKLAPAMQRIGANTAATNQVVDAFGKSLRIGGATAMEAASATIQFAQAMASGKLAGDEFRSISEASPRFLKAIADGSGIAAEKLKEMSSAGALTTEVIARALVKEYHNLSKESESLGYTLEQGTNALKTGFMSLVGEFNEGAGITKYLGLLMADLGVNMIDGASSAKQSGEAFKEWATANADNITKLIDAFQLLTTFIITRYVVAMTLARVESMKLAYQTSALAAAQTASMRAFVIGATAVTAFGRAAQTAYTFMGGWVGILLTLAGVAATYLILRDNTAEATQKLIEQSKYVDITTEAYQRLNKEQQLNARSSVVNDMNDVNKKLDEQANAVERVLKSYVMSRQFSGLGVDSGTKDVLDKVTKGVISYDTALRLLSENKSIPKNIVEDFKKEKEIYDETAKSAVKFSDAAKIVGSSTELAGNKAQNATPLIKGLSNETDALGDKAEIAGSKFSKFTKDLNKAIQDSKDTYDLMSKFDLDETYAKKLVDRVNEKFAGTQGVIDKAVEKIQSAEKALSTLEAKDPQRKVIQSSIDKAKESLDVSKKLAEVRKKTLAEVDAPLVQQAQKEAERVAELTRSRSKADKDAAKSRKEAEKDLKKFKVQALEAQTYYDVLKRVNNLDIARIASQKEYINIYKDNLAVATELANIQEMTRREENRQEYNKSLREQIEQLSVIADLTKEGVDYETAKGLAAASFANDSSGREAAEKSIMNTLLGQSYALSDQVIEQQTLNQYLKEGMGLEEARFKVALSRIAKLSGGKNTYGEFGEDFENATKSLRVLKATEASEVKINSLVRESNILTKATALGYTASNVAVAKLSAATQGLIFSQAESQLKQQEQVDLLNESIKSHLTMNSLLSGENETLREVKATYVTIGEEEAKRVAQSRKALEIAEAYVAKMKEQKANPLGDFSKVDFEVFGDFGNPFKEALDGLNSFVFGMTTLDEKIATVRESMRQYQVESELASLSGQTDKAKEMLDLANKQLVLEKDLQTQKTETNDIAYGQGLKFAKSFFKEESKGYKVVSALEMALQAKKLAFALWEKKDTIKTIAIKLAGYAKDMAMFIGGIATKITAQMGLNVVQAQGAVASAAQAPPPVGFASAAAMIALLAGIGIAISGGGGGSYVDTSNQGTGTVFGDTEAKSTGIKNSMDLLSENSDLMLPLTSAMLASLRNIESSIGGVTNLILRGELGKGFNVSEGFQQNKLGSLVGIGGLFGTKTTIKASGLYGEDQKLGDILSEGFNLQEYVDVQTKKKTFGITTSTKNKTIYADANEELANQFTLIFSGLYDSILSATDILGADLSTVQTNLENAVISIGKIDLKGLSGDEIQEKLEAVFGAAADDLAKQAFAGLDDFQKVGEGYYETLVRVASSVEQASYYTEKLNVQAINYTNIVNKQAEDLATEIVRQSYLTKVGISTVKGGMTDLVNSFDGTAEEITDFITTLEDLQEQLFMTGKSGDYLTSSMILGAGGLDGLSSGLDAYFEMLSPAEQAAELTRRLTNEFAIFGKELPADVKAFRNLVSSIDITTEAGQKLYGQIIALAPEFNDLQDALDSANSEVNALVQSLRDLAEQARGARGETDQTRNLASVRNEFDRVSSLAMQGDIAAANRLVELGEELMGVSKTYATSNEDYTRDLALIQRAATVAADLQANGLGTTVTPTLTTTAGTVATPTIETTNASMTTEMKTMREELNAGLFAIAKFVQNIDSRTDRWDDGDRVMVGVLPEVGDNPQPVAVV